MSNGSKRPPETCWMSWDTSGPRPRRDDPPGTGWVRSRTYSFGTCSPWAIASRPAGRRFRSLEFEARAPDLRGVAVGHDVPGRPELCSDVDRHPHGPSRDLEHGAVPARVEGLCRNEEAGAGRALKAFNRQGGGAAAARRGVGEDANLRVGGRVELVRHGP